jgi:hypothetical protein
LFADFALGAALDDVGAVPASLACAKALTDAATTRTPAANLSGFSAFIAILLLTKIFKRLGRQRLLEHAIGTAPYAGN